MAPGLKFEKLRKEGRRRTLNGQGKGTKNKGAALSVQDDTSGSDWRAREGNGWGKGATTGVSNYVMGSRSAFDDLMATGGGFAKLHSSEKHTWWGSVSTFSRRSARTRTAKVTTCAQVATKPTSRTRTVSAWRQEVAELLLSLILSLKSHQNSDASSVSLLSCSNRQVLGCNTMNRIRTRPPLWTPLF